jgi:hypothetical protein
MSYALNRYYVLEVELAACRDKHEVGSDQETSLLEEMSDLWWELSAAERAMFRGKVPERWPREKE